MMKALMVVESVFGNTRAVADAVAAGSAVHMHVQTMAARTAAAGAAKRLRRRHYRLNARPASFRVMGTQGPLAARLAVQPRGARS